MKNSHNYDQVIAHFLFCCVIMKVNLEYQEETQNFTENYGKEGK